MTLDQRLRRAAEEIAESIVELRVPVLPIGARQKPRPKLRTIAAIGVGIVFGVLMWSGDKPSNLAGPLATMPLVEEEREDGLSGANLLRDDWVSAMQNDVILLMEGGIGLAAMRLPDGSGGTYFNLAIDVERDVAFLLSNETLPTELAETWVGFGADVGDASVLAFGVVPFGAREVTLTLGDVDLTTTTRIFDRPEADRSVFSQEIDENVFAGLEQAPVVLTVTLANGERLAVEFMDAEEFRRGEAYLGPLSEALILQDAPLIIGAMEYETLPAVIPCRDSAGVVVEPWKGEAIPDVTFPEPAEALAAFLTDQPVGAPFAPAGYLEIIREATMVSYGIDYGSGFLTLISVSLIDGGWAVTSWETNGC